MLLSKREQLAGQIAILKNDAVAGSDSANWEEDGTDAFDREFAFKMAGSSNDLLKQIDEALRRIEEETYGQCETCAGRIGRDRIRALPFCKTCIDCQAESEKDGTPNRVQLPA
jgi:RNA polymerase-binding protein DksA